MVRCDCYDRCPDIYELRVNGVSCPKYEDLVDQEEELCTRTREPVCRLRKRLLGKK